MKHKDRLLFLFILLIACLVTTGITLSFYRSNVVRIASEKKELNTARAYTSSVTSKLSNTFPNIDFDLIKMDLDELGITALIVDLDGNVMFNNSSFETVDVNRDVNQSQLYMIKEVENVIATFGIVQNNEAKGYSLFVIPLNLLVDGSLDYTPYLLVLEIIITVIIIIYILYTFKKTVLYPVQELNKALLNVANGVYMKLEITKDTSDDYFTNYNIMLEQLERSLQIQSDYDKSRKQLIASISHEIRTPLAYVKLSAEMLEKSECVKEDQKKYIETILSKISSIDSIIEDLFSYSKQDLDRLTIEKKEIYSWDMFDRIFSNIRLKDPSKQIKIDISNSIPNVLINIDENRIDQVVSNLIDNSEKHIVEEGEIIIRTELEDNHILLIIEDNGEGISTKDLPYIFEPFYQGEQDNQTKRKGAGLGLAICEYIINKHNGEIFVFSEERQGTKFIVKFEELT